jgi:hypothetical protein
MPATETPLFLNGHPKRLLSLDDLVDIRLANFESLRKHHYLPNIRNNYNALPSQHPDKGIWLLRLADALSRKFWQLNLKEDLEEAIWYYQEALSLLPRAHYHFLEAILGFCSSVYQRFQLLGHCDDLKELLIHLHAEHNLNLESLTPVKAQLQPQPQKLVQKSSDSKLHNDTTTKWLSPLEASRILDEEAVVSKQTAKELPAPPGCQQAERKWAEETRLRKLDSPQPTGKSDPEVRRSMNARTTGDSLEAQGVQVPIQNTSLDMEDEGIHDEAWFWGTE